jgi:hypothetical protein
MTPFLLMILGMLLAAGFSLGVAFIVFRSEMPKNQLWAVISLFGAGTFSTAWEAGEAVSWSVSPLSIQLLSFGFDAGLQTGTLVLRVAVPVGAMVACYMLWRFHSKPSEPTGSGQEDSGTG